MLAGNLKIAVLGGAGFIGSNFISFILKERTNWSVVCIDALTYAADIHNLDDLISKPNFVFYREDIRNKEGIFKIFEEEKPDVVINFAAESSVDKSIAEPSIFFETNVLGTQVLLDACNKYGIKRFHQISTDEVYGDLPLDRTDLLFKEDFPLKPSSPYSASKASADLLVLSYHRTYGLPVTISRSGNNYGPHQYKDKLIPLMVMNALEDKPLPIYGDGLNVRDWIYVEDHCRAILTILEKGKDGEIYNIGSNIEKSNIEIVKLILKELNKSESLISYVPDRKGHDLRYALDCSKIRNELLWKPQSSFEKSFKQTLLGYRFTNIR